MRRAQVVSSNPDEITPGQRMAAGALAGAVAQATIYPFELVGAGAAGWGGRAGGCSMLSFESFSLQPLVEFLSALRSRAPPPPLTSLLLSTLPAPLTVRSPPAGAHAARGVPDRDVSRHRRLRAAGACAGGVARVLPRHRAFHAGHPALRGGRHHHLRAAQGAPSGQGARGPPAWLCSCA